MQLQNSTTLIPVVTGSKAPMILERSKTGIRSSDQNWEMTTPVGGFRFFCLIKRLHLTKLIVSFKDGQEMLLCWTGRY